MVLSSNQWISGTAYDDLNDSYVGYNSVAVDSLGNIVCVGSSAPLVSLSHLTELPMIIKYGRDGSVIWSYYIPYGFDGTPDSNFSYAVAETVKVDSNDNVYVAVQIRSNPQYTLLLKLNKYGTLLWSKKIQNGPTAVVDPNYNYGYYLILDSSNNIYLVQDYYFTFASFDTNGNLRWSKKINNPLDIEAPFCLVGNQLVVAVSETNNSFSLNFFNKDTGVPVSNKVIINDSNNTITPRKLVYDGTRYLYLADSNQWGIIKIDTVDYTVVWRKRFRRSDNGQSYNDPYTNIEYKNNKLYYLTTTYDLSDTTPYTGLNQRVLHIGEISSAGSIVWTNKLYFRNSSQAGWLFHNDIWTYWYYYTQNFDVANNYFHIGYTSKWGTPIGEFGGVAKLTTTGGLLANSPIGPTDSPFYYDNITSAVGLQTLAPSLTYDNTNSSTSDDFDLTVSSVTLSLSDIYNTNFTTRTWYEDGTNAGYIAVNSNAGSIINAMSSGSNTSNGGSNTSNTGSNTSNTGSNTSNGGGSSGGGTIDYSYGEIPPELYYLTSNIDFIQGGSVVYNKSSNIAQSNTIGVVMYYDQPNTYMDVYNLVNTSNNELPMTKFDVGERIWVANTNTSFYYKDYTEILYLYPPATFTIDGTSNTGNNINDSIENYCCESTSNNLIKDSFGNWFPPETIDTRCHGFAANDIIWQDRTDGKRVLALVAKEDCANGALFIDKATGLFQKDRMIYKDNGSIAANVWSVFANTTGKITLPRQYIVSMPDYGPGPNRTTPPLAIFIDTANTANIEPTDEYYVVPNLILGVDNIPIGNVNDLFANANLSFTTLGLKVTDYVNSIGNKLLNITSNNKTNTAFTIDVNGGLTTNSSSNLNSNILFSVANSNSRLFLVSNANSAQTFINAKIDKTMHVKTYTEDALFVRSINGVLTLDLRNSHTFIVSTDATPAISTINIIKPSYDLNANVAYSATMIFGGSAIVSPSAWVTAGVQWPGGIKPNIANSKVISILNTSDSNTWYGFSGTSFIYANTGSGNGLGPGGVGHNFIWYDPAKSYTFTILNSWTSDQGTDLDTRTWITVPNASPSWANVVLGWNYASNVYIGTAPSNVAQTSIVWSGDDTTSSGYEKIVIPIETIIASDPALYYGEGTYLTGYNNVYSYGTETIAVSNMDKNGLVDSGWYDTDDGYYGPISLPWNFNFANGNVYTEVYVGSNGYLTFGGGSGTINGGSTNPEFDKILLCNGDRRNRFLYYGVYDGVAPNRRFRIYIEDIANYSQSGIDTVYQITFYENDNAKLDIEFGINGTNYNATTGIYSASGVQYLAPWGNLVNSGFTVTAATLSSTPIYTTAYTNPYIDIHVGAFWYGVRNNGYFNFEIKNDITGSKISLLPNVQHRNQVGTGLNEWAVFRLYLDYLNLVQIV